MIKYMNSNNTNNQADKMDTNKENESYNFFGEESDMFFPYEINEMYDMDANPLDIDDFGFNMNEGGDERVGTEEPELFYANPRTPSEPDNQQFQNSQIADIQCVDNGVNNYSYNIGGRGEVEEEGRVEETPPVYVFADGTVQRLFDTNKLIFVINYKNHNFKSC